MSSELEGALRSIVRAIERRGFEYVSDEIGVCTGDIFGEDEDAPEWTDRLLSALSSAVRTVQEDEEGMASITLRTAPGTELHFAWERGLPIERDDFRDAIETAVQRALDGVRQG